MSWHYHVYICAFQPDICNFSMPAQSNTLLSGMIKLQIPSNLPSLQFEPKTVLVSRDCELCSLPVGQWCSYGIMTCVIRPTRKQRVANSVTCRACHKWWLRSLAIACDHYHKRLHVVFPKNGVTSHGKVVGAVFLCDVLLGYKRHCDEVISSDLPEARGVHVMKPVKNNTHSALRLKKIHTSSLGWW